MSYTVKMHDGKRWRTVAVCFFERDAVEQAMASSLASDGIAVIYMNGQDMSIAGFKNGVEQKEYTVPR